MRYLIAFSLLFTAMSHTTAQSSILTDRVWKISEDQMTGLGTHESLPGGTILQFHTDGSWEASAPIRDATRGTWQWRSNQQLFMTFGDDPKSRPVKILSLTDTELRLRLKKSRAVYTYTWLRKG